MEFGQVRTEQIEIHPDIPNIRTKILKSDLKDLMASIREGGVRTPVSLFRFEGKLYLVSGERRLRSVQLLESEDPSRFKTIPAVIKELKNKEEFIRSGLFENMIENIQREDVSGLDLASRIKMLIEKKYNKKEICKKIGKSYTWVEQSLKFIEEAAEGLKDQVKEGDLSLDEAKRVSRLPKENQEIVGKGLAKAKKDGDKKTVKKIKKGLDQATRVRSNIMLQKKEVRRYANTLSVVLGEMAKDEEFKDTKAHHVLSGALNSFKCVLGEYKDLTFTKWIKRYDLVLDKEGNKKRVVVSPKQAAREVQKKIDAKKTTKKTYRRPAKKAAKKAAKKPAKKAAKKAAKK